MLLTLMFYDHAIDVVSERMLFHDAITTNLAVPGASIFAKPPTWTNSESSTIRWILSETGFRMRRDHRRDRRFPDAL